MTQAAALPAPVRTHSATPPRPLAPLSGAVTDGAAVTFQWEGVPGAHGYRVEVSTDRQFARGVIALDVGPSTEVVLTDSLPVTDAHLFWRVRAELERSPTRWSPYGRFRVGSDDAVDAFRLQQEAERAEARKEWLRRKTEAERTRDLVPQWQRDDTNPTGAEIVSIGITMLGTFVLLIVLLLLL